MARGHLSRGSIILGGNCPGAIIWGQFSSVGIFWGVIVRGAIVWGVIVLGGNCPGEIVLSGNCPGGNRSGGNCLKGNSPVPPYPSPNTQRTTKEISCKSSSANEKKETKKERFFQQSRGVGQVEERKCL